jgi:hypothetical protein
MRMINDASQRLQAPWDDSSIASLLLGTSALLREDNELSISSRTSNRKLGARRGNEELAQTSTEATDTFNILLGSLLSTMHSLESRMETLELSVKGKTMEELIFRTSVSGRSQDAAVDTEIDQGPQSLTNVTSGSETPMEGNWLKSPGASIVSVNNVRISLPSVDLDAPGKAFGALGDSLMSGFSTFGGQFSEALPLSGISKTPSRLGDIVED